MTDEARARKEARLRDDTNEGLIQRFAWYITNFNPLDFERCDDYELVKAEVLRRMEANNGK